MTNGCYKNHNQLKLVKDI